jgi:hypothetical protein
MKKATVHIALNPNYNGEDTNTEYSGYSDGVFTIHKGSPKCFTVSHLRSGLRIADRERLKDAKE